MLLVCCASTPPVQSPEPEPVRTAPAAPQATERPELNLDEQTLRDRLAEHVRHLSVDIGERNPDKPWELAEAADYVARQFEEMGYAIERQGYEAGGVAAQNLVATVQGGERGDQELIVAAHYDSPPGDVGANAGGTGTAAILELARIMQNAPLTRTLKFAVFAMGESPHGDGAARGGRQYMRNILEKGRKREEKLEREREARDRGDIPDSLPPLDLQRPRVLGMIALDRLGAFEVPNRAAENGGTGPGQAIHLQLGASANAQKLVDSLLSTLEEPPIIVHASQLPEGRKAEKPAEGAAADSDQVVFQQAGIPVVWMHGSGGARATDFDAMARVVMRLRAAIGHIVGEKHLQNSPYASEAPHAPHHQSAR